MFSCPSHCRRLAALTALLLGLFAGSAAAQPPGSGKYALIVGVREYSEEKSLNELAYAERDATELARALQEAGFKEGNVVLMTQTAGVKKLRFLPTRERIRKELQLLLAGRKAGDTVIVAFAGHGVQFVKDGHSYFCPADAEL